MYVAVVWCSTKDKVGKNQILYEAKKILQYIKHYALSSMLVVKFICVYNLHTIDDIIIPHLLG